MKIEPCSKTYEGVTVLDFPGITLEPGKIYAVIGANGSGKSTFAKVLAGIIPADQGAVGPRVKVGYLPQKSYAFRMTTRANLLLGGRDPEKAQGLMEKLGISPLADKRADRLSGGETARMALARLMMGHFELLILDEPTASMDMESTVLSEALITDYVRQTGCALLLVTHSLQQARRMADEVLFFHKGKLLEAGPKEQVLDTPTREETKKFLDFYGV